MKRCVFLPFSSKNDKNSTMFDGLLRFQISEKWANLRFPLNIQKQKVFQLQRARHAPLPNPKYATAYEGRSHAPSPKKCEKSPFFRL